MQARQTIAAKQTADASKSLEAVEEHLDAVALPVEGAVNAPLLRPILTRGDHGLEAARTEFVEDGVGVVTAVGDAGVAGDEVDKLVCDGAVVLLARCEEYLKGPAMEVDGDVDLRRQAAARAAYLVFLGPPRPPAASW